MPLIYTDTPESSAIARVGYDVTTQRLTIVFRDKYQYPEYVWGGVPEEFAGNFLLAPSKGKFYHNFLHKDDFYRVEPTAGSYLLGSIGKRIERKAKQKVARANIARAVRRASPEASSAASRAGAAVRRFLGE